MKKIVLLSLGLSALVAPAILQAKSPSLRARATQLARRIQQTPAVRRLQEKLGLTPEDPRSVKKSFVIDDTIDQLGKQPPPLSRSLKVLYQTDVGLFGRKVAVSGKVNTACGIFQSTRLSKLRIKPFIKEFNINVDEIEKPVKAYKTFNEFFIRKLKPGARTIDERPMVVVSPADCSLSAIADVSATKHFMIKGTGFTVPAFLNNKALAQEYTDGTLLIFRLAPEDYHRFHFPINCTPSKPITIDGIYDSVNPVVYKTGFQPLVTNERHLVTLTSDLFSPVLMVIVGAMCVGKIVETYKPH